MRKVLSFVLVLALVLSSFSMAFADDAATTTDAAVTAPATETATVSNASALSDIDGLDCEQAVKVLVDLGVIKGYTDNTYKPANTVTRAEAAVIVIKALGLDKSVGSQKSNYTDMAGYGWAEPYIAFASNLGILQGYGDGTYKPGAVVSYNEFAAIMVRSLGYTTDSLTGTWPGNYVNKAAGLGIMDDITSGGNNGANRGDVAIMTSNNLTNYIGTIDKDGNFESTLLEGTRGQADAIYDCYVQRLGGEEKTDVVLDVEDAVINAMPYLGKYCTYYVNDDNEIIAVKTVKSTTLTGDYTKADNELEVGDVTYNTPSNASAADWDWDDDTSDGCTARSIVNAFDAGDLADAPDNGTYTMEVKLSGKTIKEVYSVSSWTVTEDEQVDADDIADLKDGKLLGCDFDLDTKDNIIDNSFELIGVASLDDIEVDDIVYVYCENKLKANDIKRVAVGQTVVEGTIEKASEDADNTEAYYTIKGTKYYGAEVAATDIEEDELSNDVKLYLDAYGDVYDYEMTSGSADDYAVVKAIDYIGAGGTAGGNVKLYLADDTTKTFSTDLDTADETLFDQLTVGAIIGYSLNKDGDIDAIECDDPTATDRTAKTITSNKMLSDGTAVDSDVVVFLIDGDGAYSMGKIADIEKDEALTTFVYIMDDNKIVAMLVNESASTGSTTDSYAVISAATSATNSVGDKAYELTGFIDGKAMSDVKTSSKGVLTVADIEDVNVFKIKYNEDKNISRLTKLVNGQNDVVVVTGYATGTADDVQKFVTDGRIRLNNATGVAITAGTGYALSDNVMVYSVSYKDNDIDEYDSGAKKVNGETLVYLYNFDETDDTQYDLIIYVD